MTAKQEIMLARINEYAEKVMPDIDPQKTQVSVQLDKLRPIFETLAKEQGRAIEDIFIEYMDLASEFKVKQSKEFKEQYADIEGVQADLFKID